MSDQSESGRQGTGNGGTTEGEPARQFDDLPPDEEGQSDDQGPDTRQFDDEPSEDDGS